MRKSNILLYILVISVLFTLPVGVLAANGNANENANKNKTNEVVSGHKKDILPHGQSVEKVKSHGKPNKETHKLPEQANQNASEQVNKKKIETPSDVASNHKKDDKNKNAHRKKKKTPNHGQKVSEKAKGSRTKANNKNNKQETNDSNTPKQRESKNTKPSLEPNDSNSHLLDTESDSIVQETPVEQVDQGSRTGINQQQEQVPAQESERKPKSEPIHRPTHVILTSPPESPISGNGGSSSSQASSSFMLKADVIALDRNIQPGQTQFWRSRIEMFRNQWVNAPPVQPPTMTP